ncbi:MAG: hypothetical protein RBS80_31125, partial [Thermoguttaceae bacterium]|nr:hypothetical protein [Thermoguttaceae bacterium]
MVPAEPQNLGPKLSKSLVNDPLWVNRPVPFGGREEHGLGRGDFLDLLKQVALGCPEIPRVLPARQTANVDSR